MSGTLFLLVGVGDARMSSVERRSAPPPSAQVVCAVVLCAHCGVGYAPTSGAVLTSSWLQVAPVA